MERYNLKSSIEFGYLLKDKTDYEYRQLRDSYDYFLKQPLTLGMFVPCDEDGNLLEEPKDTNKDSLAYDWFHEQYRHKLVIYKQAQERVLFDGLEVPTHGRALEYFKLWLETKSKVEDLVGIKQLTLTPYALKQIGL